EHVWDHATVDFARVAGLLRGEADEVRTVAGGGVVTVVVVGLAGPQRALVLVAALARDVAALATAREVPVVDVADAAAVRVGLLDARRLLEVVRLRVEHDVLAGPGHR